MKSIHVPEWDETIYYRSFIDVRQMLAVEPFLLMGKLATMECGMALFQATALDEDGILIFDNAAGGQRLQDSFDPKVIDRVLGEMGVFGLVDDYLADLEAQKKDAADAEGGDKPGKEAVDDAPLDP